MPTKSRAKRIATQTRTRTPEPSKSGGVAAQIGLLHKAIDTLSESISQAHGSFAPVLAPAGPEVETLAGEAVAIRSPLEDELASIHYRLNAAISAIDSLVARNTL